jgi:hypothetical protein
MRALRIARDRQLALDLGEPGGEDRWAMLPEQARLRVLALAEAESRLAAAGAVRNQAIVVETEPVAVGFWRTTSWEQHPCRLRFVES